MADDAEYISVSGICGKRKGWTKGRITKFLGEPDKLVRNPHYSTAAPMRLYDLDRVEAAEATTKFQDSIAKTEDRKITGIISAEKRRQRQRDMAMIIPIRTDHLPLTSDIPDYELEDMYCENNDAGRVEYLCRCMLTPEISSMIRNSHRAKEIILRRMLDMIQDRYPKLHRQVRYELWVQDGRPIKCKWCGGEHTYTKQYHPYCGRECFEASGGEGSHKNREYQRRRQRRKKK